jgi:NAD(P)H-hydrate epimerase
MILASIYPKREDWVHKGQFGRLLIVAGSKVHTGSPVFNGMAAMRSGCDLVTIATPWRSADVCANFAPDLITYPLNGDYLSKIHIKEILGLLSDKTALLIGGGLGRDKSVFEAILEIIKAVEIPCVLDAEALRALAGNLNILKGKKAILTPHANEFETLSQEKVSGDIEERKLKAKKFAQEHGVILVLKGHFDVVTDGMLTSINGTGSTLMTKGGFGDTLAGICAGILARGVSLFESASAGTYINGRAGQLACEKYGESVLASDIFEFIPQVIAPKG